MSLEAKEFEIFSGTGGVGKTTLAASRAIEIAKSGKSVLLITIDPAKRLRELLNIDLEQAGQVIQIPDPFSEKIELPLFVELMDPQKTFERMANESECTEVLSNRILKVLTRPYGGLNEILAIVELSIQRRSKRFDVIVLDTPPGSHFLDFLDSVERIKFFFDQSFIDIFNFLGKKIDQSKKLKFGKKMANMVASTAVKKLLSYLNKVTGDKFIDDFIEAIIAVYKTKSSFMNALDLQQVLKDSKHSNWYLVTSVEQNKLQEALDLKAHAKGHMSQKTSIVLNKCIEENLKSWKVEKGSEEEKLKLALSKRESNLKNNLAPHFDQVLEFPEIFTLSPLEHVQKLTEVWIEK